MPSEDDLRTHFRDDEPGGAIDVDAVLRRSRARRRPRVVALALVSSLAVLGILVPVSISVASQQTGTFSAGSAASAPEVATDGGSGTDKSAAGGSSVERAPADKINLCAGTLAVPASAEDGLVLTVHAVDAAASDRDIPVTVRLTNTGTQQVRGSLSPFPAITFSRGGVVLWHSNGAVPALAREIDLAPGASTTFSTSFEPLICGVADDSLPSFGTALPEAGPGSYQLSAALDFTPATADASGTVVAVLVSGPASSVTLR